MPNGERDASASRLKCLPYRFGLYPVRSLEDVSFQGLAVWLYATGDTPGEECLRVDYDSDDQMVSGLPAALVALGLLTPSFIAPGDIIRIEHDFAHSRVCVRFQPSNAPSLHQT